MRQEVRDKIISQAQTEIEFARQYKQGKISNWQKNENLYNGRKVDSTDDARANVELGQMSSFVHSLLSKVDNALVFKFVKRKNSQYQRVKHLNGLREYDAKRDYWNLKDIVGKKQAIIYGRAIYAYYASSDTRYKPHLDNVDVYDFLIDPAAGGIDIERAMYIGRYGVIKTHADLKALLKDDSYIKPEIKRLLETVGNATQDSQEDTNKHNRSYGSQQASQSQTEIVSKEKYKFWEWFTTYEGERYYMLLDPKAGCAIKLMPLKEMFKSNLWPFWTYAAYPDLTEFWTPSFCDYVREIYIVQNININQMVDNAEQINKPQRLVDASAIENLAELKYKKNGHIIVKNGVDVNKAYQVVMTPSISTPLEVYKTLDMIQEKNSGVTSGAKGVSEEDKVGIYEGNQANAADRFGLLNKTYAFGYERFAKLWECGAREHLTKKESVEILGPDGIELVEIDHSDLFAEDGDEYGIMVEASDAEEAVSMVEKKSKLTFLSSTLALGLINPKKAIEIQAQIVGFTDEVIRQLLDVNAFGDSEIMAEAERDIEKILAGEAVLPNAHANTAYKQKFVDYMQDKQENITDEQFRIMSQYIISLDEIIMGNMARKMSEQQLLGTGQPQPGAPAGMPANDFAASLPDKQF